MTEGQDVFIRLQKDGKTTINHHRVWDRDRFFSAQVEQYSGSKTKPDDVHLVSIASKADYAATHKRNGKS